jgi:hypothetical protein
VSVDLWEAKDDVQYFQIPFIFEVFIRIVLALRALFEAVIVELEFPH